MLKSHHEKDQKGHSSNRIQSGDKTDFKMLMKMSSGGNDMDPRGQVAVECLDPITAEYVASLSEQLQTKENDLILAAEIGQHLLVSNQELLEEVNRLKQELQFQTSRTSTPRKVSVEQQRTDLQSLMVDSNYLDKLEEENVRLRRDVEHMRTPTGTPNGKSGIRQTVDMLENELHHVRRELDMKTLECDDMRAKLRKVSKEKQQRMEEQQAAIFCADSSSEITTCESGNGDSLETQEVRKIVETQSAGIQVDLITETLSTFLMQNEELKEALEKRLMESETLLSRINTLEGDKLSLLTPQARHGSLADELKEATKSPDSEKANKNILELFGELVVAVVLCPLIVGKEAISAYSTSKVRTE